MSIPSLFDLSNQTALVIGACSGLGKRAAEVLAEAGARVILASIRLDKLKTIAKSLKNSRAIKMDVAEKTSVQAAFETLESEGEKINIVLCAAGISGQTPIFNIQQSSDYFEREIQTNVVGLWYVIQYASNHMKECKIAGSIISIASICGIVPLRPKVAAYSASKAAVIDLTHTLAGELAEFNIRFNCIAPGLFHTAMTDYKLNTPQLKQKMANTIALQFVADPCDLDGLVLYLASNKASRYVTGSCFTIDGGESWVRRDQVQAPHPSGVISQESKNN